MLPCDWRLRLQVTPLSYHVQWLNQLDTVLEQWGHSTYEAPEFQQRLEVQAEEKLEAGDCSLIINDVQMADAGHYESFMVVDIAPSEKTRVFIDSVHLLVQGQGLLHFLLIILYLFFSACIFFTSSPLIIHTTFSVFSASSCNFLLSLSFSSSFSSSNTSISCSSCSIFPSSSIFSLRIFLLSVFLGLLCPLLCGVTLLPESLCPPDHKSLVVKAPGENLELLLHTRHSVRVIFQSRWTRQTNSRSYRGHCCLTDNCVFLVILHRNSSQWTNLWVRENVWEEWEEVEEQQQQNRVVKDPVKEQLTIRSVTVDDGGTYKVLDPEGLAISTTQLSIQGEALTAPLID